MATRSSFRLPGEKGINFLGGKSQNMFKSLRRLHGQNLESQGLNDLTEAFQNFVTRARFFSVGKLRRTWSHSAVEFMKYRRLLPMLLADGQQFDGDETDSFDAVLSFQATHKDDRKIIVSNISPRVTVSQLQSFFSQFGKIVHCHVPREDTGSKSGFSTLGRSPKVSGAAVITFSRVEEAEKAKSASDDVLKFYDQIMTVTAYVSRKKGKGMVLADEKSFDDAPGMSRASSSQSLLSTSSLSSNAHCFPLRDIPQSVLSRIISFLPLWDTVRLERVNKTWMEASMQSWSHVDSLSFTGDGDGRTRTFSQQNPLRNVQLRAILRRAGAHVKRLDLSGIVHLLDDKSLQLIANCCPNIMHLDLSGVQADWQSLAELGDSLTNLRSFAYRDMVNITDKHVWFVVRGSGPVLECVDLRGCKRLRGRFTKLFGPKLQSVYLDGCSRIDEAAIEDLCTASTNLKELRLNECFRLSDRSINIISRTLVDLQTFTLCGDNFVNISTSGLAHIARLTKLVEIALDFNPLVTDTLLAHFIEGLPELKSLSLANAGTDQSLTMNGLKKLGQLKKLEQVDLSSIAAVRSPVVVELCVECKNLELVQLRNCIYLCDDGVTAFARARSLRHLDLSGSILVTSNSIQDVIKAFPHEEGSATVTVVVGGTVAEERSLRVRGSRVAVDFSDYSALVGMPQSKSSQFYGDVDSDEDEEDDFQMLTAQRSFYIDAVCGEDDSPLENEKDVIEWATREAKNLGLIKK